MISCISLIYPDTFYVFLDKVEYCISSTLTIYKQQWVNKKYSCYLLLFIKWLNDTFSTAKFWWIKSIYRIYQVYELEKIFSVFIGLLDTLKTQMRLNQNCCIKWQESFLCRMSTKAQEKPRWTAYFQVAK